MKVQEYLDRYYWTAEKLAENCGLTSGELEALVAAGAIPKPSYIVMGPTLESAAFGPLPAFGAGEGSYYNPATVNWIARAQEQSVNYDPYLLEEIFANNMAVELAILNRSVWRLTDCFDDDSVPNPAGMEKRIESYWRSFNLGIFGLCVANPVSESEIALKEILQEKLTLVTNNGAKIADHGISKKELVELIQAYADTSMPFSPVEYPLSSRKRLVDDLLAQFSTIL